MRLHLGRLAERGHLPVTETTALRIILRLALAAAILAACWAGAHRPTTDIDHPATSADILSEGN